MNYSFHTNTGVKLLWRGTRFPNNSIVNIEEIGEGVDALACQTDIKSCCRDYRIGEWYYPNGSRVPVEGEGALFYRNRSDEGLVLLHRRIRNRETAFSTGLFCCTLPDASFVIYILCIELLPRGKWRYKLICIIPGMIIIALNSDRWLN